MRSPKSRPDFPLLEADSDGGRWAPFARALLGGRRQKATDEMKKEGQQADPLKRTSVNVHPN